MKKSFEEITNDELVKNLGPDDLIVHARHMFLCAAKDLCKQSHPDDQAMGHMSVDVVLSLQEALENFGPTYV